VRSCKSHLDIGQLTVDVPVRRHYHWTRPQQSFRYVCRLAPHRSSLRLLTLYEDEDVQRLKEAVWTHKVVVVKGQKDLEPRKQWELVTRFDPDAEQVHSHGDLKTFAAKGGMLSKSRDVFGIPGAENVRLIGKGFQGEDHFGIKNTTIKGLSADWHAKPLPDEEFQAGHTRFQRWHMDAPLYDREPALFTTLRCIKQPQGPDVTIAWDDDSGHSMKSKPGLTGFFSSSQLYNLLTEDEQCVADNSW
jgi:alpha-ketoglutarate-dependent taurine dioxygenase